MISSDLPSWDGKGDEPLNRGTRNAQRTDKKRERGNE